MLCRPPDEVALVFSSHDALDWWRNFQVRLMQHPDLGGIDAGLFAGNDVALGKIKTYLNKDKPVRLYAHSRGGSNAIYTGASLLLGGYKVAVRAFNPPRTQHQTSTRLSQIYAGQDILIIRTDCDPVSLEPPGYVHPVEPEKFTVAPVDLDPELEMKYHHIHLNIVGMALKERGFYGQFSS
jgi:hypothetical protein